MYQGSTPLLTTSFLDNGTHIMHNKKAIHLISANMSNMRKVGVKLIHCRLDKLPKTKRKMGTRTLPVHQPPSPNFTFAPPHAYLGGEFLQLRSETGLNLLMWMRTVLVGRSGERTIGSFAALPIRLSKRSVLFPGLAFIIGV